MWTFIQEQILGMKWLNVLIGKLLNTLGLNTTEKIGGTIQFFIYDVIKIVVLLCTLIFIISYIQSYFPPERTKKILGRFHGTLANIIAALLGTVTPSLAKYTTQSLSENGKIVGTLGAFNTIGSIIGTFLPTFVTIPKVGTAVTFLIFSGILLLISLAYFFSEKSHKVACIVSIVLFAVFAILGVRGGFAFWENDLAYEGESVYNYLQVKEDDKQVILATNVLFGVQSIHMKEGGLTGLYYDDALAAPVMAGVTEKTNAKMLVLGMGTGTYATLCERYFPNMKTVGVEIDEKITGLAGEYFNLDEDIPVVTYDGRAYLSGIEKESEMISNDLALLRSRIAEEEESLAKFKEEESLLSKEIADAEEVLNEKIDAYNVAAQEQGKNAETADEGRIVRSILSARQGSPCRSQR